MRVLILAAGYATRFRPLTLVKPKPLLPVGGSTILHRIIEETQDLGEVVVRTNRAHAPMYEAALEGWDVTIEIEEHASDAQKKGAVATILEVAAEQEDDLLVVGGDNVYGWGLKDFVKRCEGQPGVACIDVGTKDEARRFGIVDLGEDGVIDTFVEKPQDPPSTLAATATYHLPKELGARLQEYKETGGSLDAPGNLIAWLSQVEEVRGIPMDGAWFDVGTFQGYLDALAELDEEVGHARAAGADLQGMVAIHDGATVKGGRLEDVVVLEGATVENADLKRCVVSPDAVIKGARLRNSLIGPWDQLNG